MQKAYPAARPMAGKTRLVTGMRILVLIAIVVVSALALNSVASFDRHTSPVLAQARRHSIDRVGFDVAVPSGDQTTSATKDQPEYSRLGATVPDPASDARPVAGGMNDDALRLRNGFAIPQSDLLLATFEKRHPGTSCARRYGFVFCHVAPSDELCGAPVTCERPTYMFTNGGELARFLAFFNEKDWNSMLLRTIATYGHGERSAQNPTTYVWTMPFGSMSFIRGANYYGIELGIVESIVKAPENGLSQSARETEASPSTDRAFKGDDETTPRFTMTKFRDLALGRTREEIDAEFGAPDTMDYALTLNWNYFKLPVYDTATGLRFDIVTITFGHFDTPALEAAIVSFCIGAGHPNVNAACSSFTSRDQRVPSIRGIVP